MSDDMKNYFSLREVYNAWRLERATRLSIYIQMLVMKTFDLEP